ncbi:MAG TPA: hypothetical protein VNX25_04750, partial [Verrucomicrobiae bacterium]|nr:hypothetical protein [Verrucomicrobiae bacterium]
MGRREYEPSEEDPWIEVRHTREAIRARARLVLYAAAATVPFILLVGAGGVICGLMAHEVIGVSCYQAMAGSIFFFDTLRNAAHACFDEARDLGLVTVTGEGIPLVDAAYPHRRLAALSFAVGGRP